MSEHTEEQGQKPIDVYQVIMIMVDQMSGMAWQKMGLQVDPMTGKIEKDMAQAKVAVDVTSQLCDHLVDLVDGEDKRRLQNLMSDLKVNFVQKSAEEGQ